MVIDRHVLNIILTYLVVTSTFSEQSTTLGSARAAFGTSPPPSPTTTSLRAQQGHTEHVTPHDSGLQSRCTAEQFKHPTLSLYACINGPFAASEALTWLYTRKCCHARLPLQ